MTIILFGYNCINQFYQNYLMRNEWELYAKFKKMPVSAGAGAGHSIALSASLVLLEDVLRLSSTRKLSISPTETRSCLTNRIDFTPLDALLVS